MKSDVTETPPNLLRQRIMYYQTEYDELRKFTTLEKQIYNNDSKEDVSFCCIHTYTRRYSDGMEDTKTSRKFTRYLFDIGCIKLIGIF